MSVAIKAYVAVLLGGSLLILLYLVKNDPALLRRRLRSGPFFEPRISQKIIMFFVIIGFWGIFAVSTLDLREGWSHPPLIVEIIGNIAVAVGLLIIFLVYRENSFAAATIQVEPGQKVIMTGPYSVVRHPLYAGLLIMCMGTPLALGSYWGLPVSLTLVPCFIWRLIDEEHFLTDNLPGYAEYREKVRRRLIPAVF
jgi:protein-S-isoprenylcysteine O-methyltransferase Ste14